MIESVNSDGSFSTSGTMQLSQDIDASLIDTDSFIVHNNPGGDTPAVDFSTIGSGTCPFDTDDPFNNAGGEVTWRITDTTSWQAACESAVPGSTFGGPTSGIVNFPP